MGNGFSHLLPAHANEKHANPGGRDALSTAIKKIMPEPLLTKNKLDFPELLNVRDLGGYPTRDGAETLWKSLLRSDEANRLTPQGAKALMDYGVRTVIDLRFAHEAQERPNTAQLDRARLNCVYICLCGGEGDEWRSFYKRGESREKWNCAIIEESRTHIRDVMRAIAEAPEGGILFHCVSGKDRTGLIAALLLALADVRPDAIEQDYTVSTENLRDAYIGDKTGAEREKVLHRVYCPGEQIHNMLAHLDERHGGVAGYLRAIGLSDDEIGRIRARLRES